MTVPGDLCTTVGSESKRCPRKDDFDGSLVNVLTRCRSHGYLRLIINSGMFDGHLLVLRKINTSGLV